MRRPVLITFLISAAVATGNGVLKLANPTPPPAIRFGLGLPLLVLGAAWLAVIGALLVLNNRDRRHEP